MDWPDMTHAFDVQGMLTNLLQLAIAFAMAVPMGWDREQKDTLGMRTFPLIAMASCGIFLLGQNIAQGDPPPTRASSRV